MERIIYNVEYKNVYGETFRLVMLEDGKLRWNHTDIHKTDKLVPFAKKAILSLSGEEQIIAYSFMQTVVQIFDVRTLHNLN